MQDRGCSYGFLAMSGIWRQRLPEGAAVGSGDDGRSWYDSARSYAIGKPSRSFRRLLWDLTYPSDPWFAAEYQELI